MLTTTMGRITINNANDFSRGNYGFQISALLQELMVYAGQMQCYGHCQQVIEKFLSVQVSSTQVYRLTDLYGKELEETVDFTTRTQPPLQAKEKLYVEADASMVLTRQQGWKEVKVGRVFKSTDCLHPQGKQGMITHSQYLAQMGSHKNFSEKMDTLIEDYTTNQQQMIFISDGAPWLRNWIEDAFPQATSILDFYHLLEHLYQFSEAFFGDTQQAKQWVEQQKELLLESCSEKVISNVQGLAASKRKQPLKAKLLAYLEANRSRMDYKHYQTIGCGIIGSGAIESAHRTVVQKRMKLSGQRWSKTGAQHMLHLRVLYMNQQWDKVIQLAKTNLANSA
jgi:Uncharacterised protein family (UPF0236)